MHPTGWSSPQLLDFHGLVLVHRGGFQRRLDGWDDFIGRRWHSSKDGAPSFRSDTR